jgi:hypothetical protein
MQLGERFIPLIVNGLKFILDNFDNIVAAVKFLLKDIPLFWKERISKINHGSDENKLFKKARNLALYHSANSRIYMNNMMVQKGVNWSELREKRTRLPLYYLKDLLS